MRQAIAALAANIPGVSSGSLPSLQPGLARPPVQLPRTAQGQGETLPTQQVVPSVTQSQGLIPLHVTVTSQPQDATTQVLLSATQLLSSVEGLSAPVLPTAPRASADNVQNALAELKRQINAMAALSLPGAEGMGNKDIIQSSTPLLGPKSPAASEAATGSRLSV
ncbi:hypothetical protein NDU88_002427 [Pleurodeles waltl]|uniref:Uncharacterized protein n=1 Tax=Pleurodeles waltl TaxID=8319 RepID=A0AAV7T3H1_PLEWA|nr:hypothetical protein NDU88_002427 [Pleurodeles waltl]